MLGGLAREGHAQGLHGRALRISTWSAGADRGHVRARPQAVPGAARCPGGEEAAGEGGRKRAAQGASGAHAGHGGAVLHAVLAAALALLVPFIDYGQLSEPQLHLVTATPFPSPTGWPSSTAAPTPSSTAGFNENFRRGFQAAPSAPSSARAAVGEPQEAYSQRASRLLRTRAPWRCSPATQACPPSPARAAGPPGPAFPLRNGRVPTMAWPPRVPAAPSAPHHPSLGHLRGRGAQASEPEGHDRTCDTQA